MANDGMSCPTLTNCTFVDNVGRDMFGGLYNGTGPTNTGNSGRRPGYKDSLLNSKLPGTKAGASHSK